MSINEIQDEIIAEFEDFDDWMDRYQMLIEQGSAMEPIDEKLKTNDNLIDGCQSRVWVAPEMKEGRMYIHAESDALIVKGIVALLVRVFNGQTPKDILEADLYFIPRIGLNDHLSPTRSNGLAAMIKQIRLYALTYSAEVKS